MRSRAWLGTGLVCLLGLGVSGCFPDYSIASGGSAGSATGGSAGSATGGSAGSATGGSAGSATGGSAGSAGAAGSAGGGGEINPTASVVIQPPELNVAYNLKLFDTDLGTYREGSVKFTHAIEVDVYEVTVERFLKWDAAGREFPDSEYPLDPGGPYEATMTWDSMWPVDAHPRLSGECYAPVVPGGKTTWQLEGEGRANLPMTCVSWYEAVAFCAWEGGKRLLTHAEWIYVASGGNQYRGYPWGDEPPTSCRQAIWLGSEKDHCGFPIAVGSTPDGRTEHGVYDMSGSVFEWVWDETWFEMPTGGATNYLNPGSGATPRSRKGGAYIVPELANSEAATNNRLRIDFDDPHPATDGFADAGFRCARSVIE